MRGFFFRLIPPRPDFASSMTEDERSKFTTEIAPMLRLVTATGQW